MQTRRLGQSDLHLTPLGFGACAIAWTLRRPAVTGAIVGARNAEQVDGFIGAMDFRLSPAEQQQLEDFFGQHQGAGGEAHF